MSLFPPVSWGLPDAPAALAHMVDQIMVRDSLHANHLIVVQCILKSENLSSEGLGTIVLTPCLCAECSPRLSPRQLLGLEKEQITSKGRPFLWISVFQLYTGFPVFDVSAPFCPFRFLDPQILNAHFRSPSPNPSQQLGSCSTSFWSEIGD